MLAVQCAVPPFVVHLVVIEHGNVFPKVFHNVSREQNLREMIVPSKLGELRFAEEFLQLAFLGFHRPDGSLLDLHRDVFQLGGCLDDRSK